jgi:hypothetical protein
LAPIKGVVQVRGFPPFRQKKAKGWGTLRFLAGQGRGTPADQMQVPFGYAQGRLSTPLKYASLRMTGPTISVANFVVASNLKVEVEFD